ncbi:MAG: hypothetical protein PHP37_02585 [Patescibacteria group bacterium]|nr:hypothetical protein [Patescibacteria group bacterium]
MNNFEQKIEVSSQSELTPDIFSRLNEEVEDLIVNKINSVVVAIRESGFKLDTPEIDKKIKKLSDSIFEKYFSNIEAGEDAIRENVERKILKIAIESIAKNDLGGSLGLYENLEEEYLEVLTEEGVFAIKNNSDFYYSDNDLSDLKLLVDKLNLVGILDNDKKGILFDSIKKNLLENFIRKAA